MKNDPKEKPEIIQSPGVDRERAIPPDFVPEPKLPTPPPEPEQPQATSLKNLNHTTTN